MTAPRHHGVSRRRRARRSARRGPARRGAPLLVGLAVGAVLIGAAAVATPEGTTDPAVHAALGAPLVAQALVPTPAPTRTPTRPARSPSLTVPTPPVTVPAPAPTVVASPTPTPAAPDTVDLPDPPTPGPAPADRDPVIAASGPADAVLAATNAERSAAGCDDLRADPRLEQAAQDHADDMSENGYFDHTGRDGRAFDDRIRDAGHPNPGGENIAAGQESAEDVVAAWMDSPGHRRNILDCGFTSLGVGHAPDGNYWVQNFGR